MMKRFVSAAVATLLLVSVYTGVSLADPDWSVRMGMDFWNVASLHEALDVEHQRSQDLCDQDRTVLRRVRIKGEVIQSVIDGHTTLFEAAAIFRDMNNARPEYTHILRSRFPNCTDDEVHCRNVISFVEVQLPHTPGVATDLTPQLQTQLAQHKAQNAGRVVLKVN